MIRKRLARLVELDLVDDVKTGNEKTYRIAPEPTSRVEELS